MNQLGGFPILSLLVFLPALGACAVLLVRSKRRETIQWLASLIAAANLFISLFLYMGWVQDTSGGVQFVDGPWLWIDALRLRFYFGIDGLNLHAVLLTTLTVPLVLLVASLSPSTVHDCRRVAFWTLLAESTMVGALASLDLGLFVVFGILCLLTTWFLLNSLGSPGPVGIGLGIVIVLAGALLLSAIAFASGRLPAASLEDLRASELDWLAQAGLFWSCLLALGAWGACFPLHGWYVRAHRTASPAARILIGSLLPNLGFVGILRFCLLAFPLATERFAPVLVAVGAAGTLVGGMAAHRQRALWDTLAWWNVAQIGFALVAAFCLNNLGLQGAVITMAARGLSVAAILILTDVPAHSETDSPGNLPIAHTLAFLCAVGVPGLVGFVGQSAAWLGVLRWRWAWSASAAANRLSDWATYAVIAAGLILSASALIRAWRQAAFLAGPRSSRRAWIALPLLLCMLFLGWRGPQIADMVGPTVHRLLADMRPDVEEPIIEPQPVPVPDTVGWRVGGEQQPPICALPTSFPALADWCGPPALQLTRQRYG